MIPPWMSGTTIARGTLEEMPWRIDGTDLWHRVRVRAIAVLALVSGCAASAPHTRVEPASLPIEARGQVCPGWTRFAAPGRTLFALPGAPAQEERGSARAFVHAEGEVYLELTEEVIAGLGETGSDRAAIARVLAELGDPSRAELAAGWTIVSQAETTFEGRAAAERVIDISGQAIRRERIVRAGDTMVIVATMVRRDREPANAEVLRCFERSIVWSAPPRR